MRLVFKVPRLRWFPSLCYVVPASRNWITISPDEANRLRTLVIGTTEKSDFADCDWVIEAVFEELAVKQSVFAEVEQ